MTFVAAKHGRKMCYSIENCVHVAIELNVYIIIFRIHHIYSHAD